MLKFGTAITIKRKPWLSNRLLDGLIQLSINLDLTCF
jgi:hypothetical protein